MRCVKPSDLEVCQWDPRDRWRRTLCSMFALVIGFLIIGVLSMAACEKSARTRADEPLMVMECRTEATCGDIMCDFPGTACFSGSDPRPGCRSSYECAVSSLDCDCSHTAPTCDALPTGACPGYGSSGDCELPGQICVYQSGEQCACLHEPDGPAWRCAAAPNSGCPPCTPSEGQRCGSGQVGLVCQYGICEADTFAALKCVSLDADREVFVWAPSLGAACPSICPREMPTIGSVCYVPDLRCLYGDDPRPMCRSGVRCSSEWYWWDPPEADPENCGELDPTACPAEPTAAGPCGPEGNVCTYPDGAQCACVGAAMGPEWQCAPPAAQGCPEAAPNEHHPCPGLEGLVCTYGLASAGTYVTVTCSDNVWQ
jgi:hypothetical protein